MSEAPVSPRTKRRTPAKKTVTPDPPREATPVEQPPQDKPILIREDPEPNKYAPKPKVGTPTLGRSPNFVESVGLGNLKVTHAEVAKTPYGRTDV